MPTPKPEDPPLLTLCGPYFTVIAVPTSDHKAHPWVGPRGGTATEAAEKYYMQECNACGVAFDAMPSDAWHAGLIDAIYALKNGGEGTKVVFEEGDTELFLVQQG